MVRFIIFILIIVLLLGFIATYRKDAVPSSVVSLYQTPTDVIPTLTPIPTQVPIPPAKTLPGTYQVFQTFNNCGPAALSMALGHYGITVSQTELGQALRPYQNQAGDNDDKSTTLEELAEKGKEYNFIPYHRPNGSIETMKRLIALDLPVITRTLLHENEDIGHYRVVKGYDDTTQQLIQDDSLQGANLLYSYDLFNSLWKQFGYEYLVLVPPEKKDQVEQVLGEDRDEKVAWSRTVEQIKQYVAQNPDDMYARFNLSVALYNTGDYQGSVREFEAVESQLPMRTLWYQIEPIQAYYELGQYEKVFTITDKILNGYNRAFSELYNIRGNIYEMQGNTAAANIEYEKAALYNSSKYSFPR